MYPRSRAEPYDHSIEYGYPAYDRYGYSNGSYVGNGNAAVPSPPLQPDHHAYYQHAQYQQQYQAEVYYQHLQQQQQQQLRHQQRVGHVGISPPPPQSDPLLEFAEAHGGMYQPPPLQRSQTQQPQAAPERQALHRSLSVPENWDFDANITTVLSSHRQSSYAPSSASPDHKPSLVKPSSVPGLGVSSDLLPLTPPPLLTKESSSEKQIVQSAKEDTKIASVTHPNLSANLDSDASKITPNDGTKPAAKRTEALSDSPVSLVQNRSSSPLSSSFDQPDVLDVDANSNEDGRRLLGQPMHSPPRPSDDSTKSDSSSKLKPSPPVIANDSPIVPVPTADSPSPRPNNSSAEIGPFTRSPPPVTVIPEGRASEDDKAALPAHTPSLIHVPSSTHSDSNAEMHLVAEIQSMSSRYKQFVNQITQEHAQFETQIRALQEQLGQETNIASQTEQHNRDLERRLHELKQEKENLEAELQEEKEKENLGDPCRPENSLSHVYSEYPPESTVIQNLLQAQIEFYFSDYNLKRDKRFLDQVFDGKNTGFLTVDEVMKLPRVRQLCGEKDQVIKALKRSNILTVDLDKELVGRPRFEKPREKEFPFRRTVFIFGIPRDEDESFVREMLEPFGSVSKVQFDHPDSLDTRIGWKFLNKPRVYTLFSARDHAEMIFRTRVPHADEGERPKISSQSLPLRLTASNKPPLLGATSVDSSVDATDYSEGEPTIRRSYWKSNVRCGRCSKEKPAIEGFYEAHDMSEVLCAQCGAQLADDQINDFYASIGKNGTEYSEKFYLGVPPRDMTKCKTALVVFASQRQASKCAYVRSRIGFKGAFATHFHLYSKIKKEIALSDSSTPSPSILHRSASVPTRTRSSVPSHHLHRQGSRNRNNGNSSNGSSSSRQSGNPTNGYHPSLGQRRTAGSASVGGLHPHHRSAHEPDETPSRASGLRSGGMASNSSSTNAWSNPKHTREAISGRTNGSPNMLRQSTAPTRGSRSGNSPNRGRYGNSDHSESRGNGGTNTMNSRYRNNTLRSGDRRRDPNGFRRQRSANT